jgi:hypothetical protein
MNRQGVIPPDLCQAQSRCTRVTGHKSREQESHAGNT